MDPLCLSSTEESQTPPCENADLTRWDKLFIALEDSQMRQNMLLDSLETCAGGVGSIKTQVDKLSKGNCKQCIPSMESVCRAQGEQVSAGLQRGLGELRKAEVERERRLNATLQRLLQSSREESTRLKRLEVAASAADTRPGQEPTPSPGLSRVSRAVFTAGGLMSSAPGQEVMSQLDMERSMAAISTELQGVQLQLSRVIKQVETLRKSGGDT